MVVCVCNIMRRCLKSPVIEAIRTRGNPYSRETPNCSSAKLLSGVGISQPGWGGLLVIVLHLPAQQ